VSSDQYHGNSDGLTMAVVSSGQCFYNSRELIPYLEGDRELTMAVFVSSELY
jgi:hypothetical protein